MLRLAQLALILAMRLSKTRLHTPKHKREPKSVPPNMGLSIKILQIKSTGHPSVLAAALYLS